VRALIASLLAGACFVPVPVKAQGQVAPQPSQKTAPHVRAEDGGVNEMMESIVVSAKPQAPFTLMLETEWVRVLADGGTITVGNKRRIARDAGGRIYQERWFLVPRNGNEESEMTTIQISDPNAHTLYNCFFVGDKKNVCELLTYTQMMPAVNIAEKSAAGDLPGNRGSFLHEALGKQFISGVETVGVRDVTAYNPGVFGNDRKVTAEREAWYSPQLDLNLLSIRSDPRNGKQTFTATNVVLGDPDPMLFELPAGFKVVDHRLTSPAEPN
jgi:hypothetical protein